MKIMSMLKSLNCIQNNKDKKTQLQLVFKTDVWLLTDLSEQLRKYI